MVYFKVKSIQEYIPTPQNYSTLGILIREIINEVHTLEWDKYLII